MSELGELEVKQNSISVDQFRGKQLLQVENFSPQESKLITRENFASMLIRSFAISKGNIVRQQIYQEWLKDRIGFDYKGTIANFLQAGGYNCLSDPEKDLFSSAFKRVRAHELLLQPPSRIDLAEKLRWQLDMLLRDGGHESIKKQLDGFIDQNKPLSALSEKALLQLLNEIP